MKKNKNEEIEEFDDEIVDEVLDDDILDDEIIEDDVLDDEVVEDEKPSKKDKKSKKNGKKKSKKGLKIGLGVGIPVGFIAIVLVFLMVIMPVVFGIDLFHKKNQTVATDFAELLTVNGYGHYTDPDTIKLRNSGDQIYTVDDMLSDEGWSLSNDADKLKIAAGLYSLAVTNYSVIDGTGWYCYTDSSVRAKNVTATLLIVTKSFDNFNVGVRAAYNCSTTKSSVSDVDNMFSQTISGVTKLEIAGLSQDLMDTLKGSLGYNIQQVIYDGVFAFRKGQNGGANFYGLSSGEPYTKYLMGAYTDTLYNVDKIRKSRTDAMEAAYMVNYDPDQDAVPQELDYIDEDDMEAKGYVNVINSSRKPWDTLDTIYEFGYTLTPYDEEYEFVCGNYGHVGWATYDFRASYLSDETTIDVLEDEDGHTYYRIEYVVNTDDVADACKFAKGGLVKDTKDYIQMQDMTYTLERNTIEIYDNGLIRSWERKESIDSTVKAKLKVLEGDCFGGGGTTNETHQTFSYEAVDYDPLALAARYWPQTGDKSKSNLAYDLSGYTSFADYKPNYHVD